MPKLILRCNYLKNAPPSHLQNFVQYIGTREGVEKVSDTTALLPATAKQKELIQDILNRIASRNLQGRMPRNLLHRHWKTIWILLPRKRTT